MREFKWIEWNRRKSEAHSLASWEVEAAFDRIFRMEARRDGSIQMFAEVPSGGRIWVIWQYDREYEDPAERDEGVPGLEAPIFMITAY